MTEGRKGGIWNKRGAASVGWDGGKHFKGGAGNTQTNPRAPAPTHVQSLEDCV